MLNTGRCAGPQCWQSLQCFLQWHLFLWEEKSDLVCVPKQPQMTPSGRLTTRPVRADGNLKINLQKFTPSSSHSSPSTSGK